MLFRSRVSRESAAVVCEGIAQSYEQLAASARALAGRLVSEGVREGDRVALFLDRSPTLVSTILGIQLAGAAYVPLDPGYPAARHRAVLEDAEVATVVTTSTLREALPQGADRVVCVDVPAGDAGEVELPTLSAQTPAYVLYTSGSTGRPKGVVVSHGNLRASNGARLQFYDAAPKRFLLLPSVAFDSSVAGIFWTLATGGTLIVPNDDEARDPRRLAEMIADEKVTSLLCVPSLYRQILEAGGRNLNDLELAIVAGESCSSRLVADHFEVLSGTRLFNEYGPTEATVWATVQELTARDAARAISIGRPIPGVRVDLLDAHGRLVPAGISGQARVAGPTVTEGYWRREEITAERFESAPEIPSEDAKRMYWTGDRMAWTEDGQLLFLGRQDEQIKLRGFRIEPGEIETALVDLAGFEEAAVVARSPTNSRALQLISFVRGPSVPTNWRRDLAGRLPAHMIPARLVELPALPLLPNGKVDRGRLRDMPLESEARPEERGPVPSTREQALISLWEGLLGRSGLGPDDNFFELGGHSLLVLEMARAIERDSEVTLSAADIFESPTIRGLARRIERRGESGSTLYEHLFPIQPGGRGSPFVVAIPHFFTAMFAERFRRERPVYGLRGVGLRAEGNLGRWRTMEELGEELVDEIQRRFPDEPCMLAGYSFGASMAFEAARQMEERGLPVRRLYLIAPMPLDIYRIGPLRLQLDGLRAPVSEISTAQALRRYAVENNPWTLRPYRRGWRRLVVEPKRRLLQLYGRLRRRAGLPLSPGVLHADVRVDRFRLHSRYRPGVLHTPTIFFNATEPETDAAATWRPFFRGPLEVVEIPDPHGDPKSVEAARKVILEHLADPGED